jgi:hypothetical protein
MAERRTQRIQPSSRQRNPRLPAQRKDAVLLASEVVGMVAVSRLFREYVMVALMVCAKT